MTDLLNEYRRWLAEILLGWAMRVSPAETEDDRVFGVALCLAMKVALVGLQRRAAAGVPRMTRQDR